MSRFDLVGLFLAVALSALASSAAAGPFCDPYLVGRSDSPAAYREREGRCEGLYAQQVGTVSLDVRSLVARVPSFDPGRDRELLLAWASPPGMEKDVRLRAFSFKPMHYYRMDTAVPAARGSFRWSTDVLAAEELEGEELGVIAWTELPGPGGTTRKVYLPLRAGAAAAAVRSPVYEVTIVPSERLRQVHVSLHRLDDDGNVAATVRNAEELGYGYYPSNKPTTFSTGVLGEAGFYRLEVTATPVAGPAVKQDLELYHPGA